MTQRRRRPVLNDGHTLPRPSTHLLKRVSESGFYLGGSMRLAIHTTDGGALDIADFDGPSLMEMLEHWEDANVLGFALNDGMAYIPKTAITRIDTFDN